MPGLLTPLANPLTPWNTAAVSAAAGSGLGIHPELLSLRLEQWQALVPDWLLLIGIFGAILLAALVQGPWRLKLQFVWSLIVAFAVSWQAYLLALPRVSGVLIFNQNLVSDAYSNTLTVLFCGVMVVCGSMAYGYLKREQLEYPEFYVLLLFSVFGMRMMVSSLDWVVFYIALELMSLSLLPLVCFRRHDRRSNEAALKYFILGASASAVLLYGIALLYGASGSTQIMAISLAFSKSSGAGQPLSMVAVMGALLVVIGFFFKLGAAPFHWWVSEVYEGAPWPVTAFLATAVKTAVLAGFFRMLAPLWHSFATFPRGLQVLQAFSHFFWVAAFASLTYGTLVALTQIRIKRLLAFSSIAHSGYLLSALVSLRDWQSAGVVGGGVAGLVGLAHPPQTALLFYLLSYCVMSLGVLMVCCLPGMGSDKEGGLGVYDLTGLWARAPAQAFALVVFLLSMAGIPFTGGFMGKVGLLTVLFEQGHAWLLWTALGASGAAVFVYLRMAASVYLKSFDGVVVGVDSSVLGVSSPQANLSQALLTPPVRVSLLEAAVVLALVMATLALGVWPEAVLRFLS